MNAILPVIKINDVNTR